MRSSFSRSSDSYKTYLFSYRFDGADWTFEIPATSASEAKQRVGVLGLARYDGEVIAKVPAEAGFLARAAAWIRNAAY